MGSGIERRQMMNLRRDPKESEDIEWVEVEKGLYKRVDSNGSAKKRKEAIQKIVRASDSPTLKALMEKVLSDDKESQSGRK